MTANAGTQAGPRKARVASNSGTQIGDGEVLILTRKEGEQVMIGEQIVVTVEHIGLKKVRLAIAAPLGVDVDRAEVRAQVELHGRRREP